MPDLTDVGATAFVARLASGAFVHTHVLTVIHVIGVRVVAATPLVTRSEGLADPFSATTNKGVRTLIAGLASVAAVHAFVLAVLFVPVVVGARPLGAFRIEGYTDPDGSVDAGGFIIDQAYIAALALPATLGGASRAVDGATFRAGRTAVPVLLTSHKPVTIVGAAHVAFGMLFMIVRIFMIDRIFIFDTHIPAGQLVLAAHSPVVATHEGTSIIGAVDGAAMGLAAGATVAVPLVVLERITIVVAAVLTTRQGSHAHRFVGVWRHAALFALAAAHEAVFPTTAFCVARTAVAIEHIGTQIVTRTAFAAALLARGF